MKILNEKIFGNYATVFHRTRIEDLINRVYTEGFTPGSGDMYGKGFYGTYELSSQDKPNMSETYGNIVVKFTVQIADFLIFDKEEFIKSPQGREFIKLKQNPFAVWGDLDYLMWQVDRFKMDRSTLKLSTLVGKSTSEMALFFIKWIPNFTKKCKGIIFTGSRDGHVLVAYDTKIIMPVSYRIDGTDEFVKVTPNMEYLKQVVDNRLAPQGNEVKIAGYVDDSQWTDDDDLGDDYLRLVVTHLSPMKNFIGLDGLLSSFPEYSQMDSITLYLELPKDNRVIKNLRGLGNHWTGDIHLDDVKIITLEGAPQIVQGSFRLDNNVLTSFREAPEKITKNFYFIGSHCADLEGFPKYIGGDFYTDQVNFTEKELRAVCNIIGEIHIDAEYVYDPYNI